MAKVKEQVYQEFLHEKILADLNYVNWQRQCVDKEVNEYETVRIAIEKLQKASVEQNLKTMVDLGCDFYVNATVPNPQTIFVKAIHGFFIEFTWNEALDFIEKKIKLLKDKAQFWCTEYCRINANATIMQNALNDLSNLKITDS